MSAEYTLINNRFYLQVPEDWIDNTVYYIEGPDDNDIKHSIVIAVDHNIEPPDLVDYAESRINAVSKELQGYEELKRGKLTLINQLPAYEVVFKWCPYEEIKQYKRVVYVVANDTAYMLTATFTKKTWKMRGAEVDEIIKSFNVPNAELQI